VTQCAADSTDKKCVEFVCGQLVLRSAKHVARHFIDESFQAISCTATDNQTLTNKTECTQS